MSTLLREVGQAFKGWSIFHGGTYPLNGNMQIQSIKKEYD